MSYNKNPFLSHMCSLKSDSNMVTISRLILLLSIIFTNETVLCLITRIVNGHDAGVGEIPYQVSLQYTDFFHFCGGTILNKDFVVTAGHCVVSKKKEDLRIIMGTVDVKDHRIIHNASQIYIHEKFRIPNQHSNDIALIKVHPPIKFDEYVSSVTLPRKHLAVPTGTKLLASGWGSLKGTGKNLELSLPTTLKKVKVTVIERQLCSQLYEVVNRTISPTQICTREVSTERKGVCVGDSGGPLTFDGVLIGIVSWSKKDPNCASSSYPDVHTRVAEYVVWINKHIKNTYNKV